MLRDLRLFPASQNFSKDEAVQVIPVLGAQRLMAPKVDCFLAASQTLDHKKHHWKSKCNREHGEELWRKNFQELHTETPWQSCWQYRQGAPRTQDSKNKNKVMFNSHANVVTRWLPGRAVSRIKKVSIALASGIYSFMETKTYHLCGLKRNSSNTMTYLSLE